MIRELRYPQWDVERRHGVVVIELVAPGSKFGSVHIWLDPEKADALGTRLIVEAKDAAAL